MKSRKAAVLLLGLSLVGVPSTAIYAQQVTDKTFYAFAPEEPQGSWSQTWHDGFHVGVNAANDDVRGGLASRPSRHKDFSRPNLAPMASEDYREGFNYGYQAVYDHFTQLGWRPTPPKQK
jgi:hypothetical protein